MKKILIWSLGSLFALFVTVMVLQMLASERVEVVELHTLDETGSEVITRLWVVDHEGTAYLRVGGDGSGWFTRLQANDTVKVTRKGETAIYRPEPRPALSEPVNDLMQAKYTWGDTLIGYLVGSRDGSIPIALVGPGPAVATSRGE